VPYPIENLNKGYEKTLACDIQNYPGCPFSVLQGREKEKKK
jgi:hypothetical protein